MSLSSGCPTDLLAQHFYEEPAQYQQLLTMAFGSTEPPEKQGVVSIIVKLATFFRGSPQLLLALNTILSSGYALTFAPLPTISIPHSIDRVIFTMPDESCIVDLDLETRPSNDLLNTQNSHRATLPFRTTSQMCSFVAADEYHEMNLIVEAEDAPLVMELLQFELDRTQAASLRRRYLKSLRHLNRLHGVLPPSMYLRNIVCESEFPVSGGGFSDVWVGRLGEQRVCIKVLRMFMQHENKEKLLKSLSNEVILWRQLRHPNILPFLGINIELFRPSFCITSPWMSNGDIISYASKSSMSFKEKLDYAVQIAQGLAYLHELDPPVVHGDIKGANILITDDSRQCCLADFRAIGDGYAVLQSDT
ncbi:kinase-like protein [Gymnopus androsaceus JB14]|uniref:Kinase-like protein n=1 Tax=Gymnopus androsaceus JB14 TaxID=1447944 RepID=A0A6A4I1L6_9AGAR|nr:kinase-like protein [Gymnopus androsaceus JB14]